MKLKILPILSIKSNGAFCILCKYLIIKKDKCSCKQVPNSNWIPLQKIMTHMEGCDNYTRPKWSKL